MATVGVGTTEDLKELITSEPLSVTKGSGLAGVVAAVMLPLSTALGWFDNQDTSIVIAAMALTAVVFVVVGYVIVTDQKTRARLTIESKRLAVQGAPAGETQPEDNGNGTASRYSSSPRAPDAGTSHREEVRPAGPLRIPRVSTSDLDPRMRAWP
jgi:hypothetical protein